MTSPEPFAPSVDPKKARHLRILLLIAAVLFCGGVATPIMTLSSFVFFENSFSILSGVVELLSEGRLVLFLVVAGFSIVLPVMKLYVLYRLLSPRPHGNQALSRYLHLMHEYGRWAMLDVMVVAILLVTVKLGAIASIEVHYGLYLFGASVALIMFVTQRVVKLTTTETS